jgi:hypothetical protein
VGIRLETREGEANRGKKKRKRQIDKDRAEREEEQRRKGNRISQGPLHKFRKLQGLVRKVKFPVDLKLK